MFKITARHFQFNKVAHFNQFGRYFSPISMDRRIIIIGAGAAGFATASKLMSHGFQNIIILEAENRFGGRVDTIPFGANVVDMGAQW